MLSKSLENAAEFMSGNGTAIVLIAAIVFGSLIGIVMPEAGNTFSSQIDNTILLLVFLLLFEVRIQNLLSSLNRISFIAVALLVNFVIIPALGFAIASVFLSGHPFFFIGLLIYFMAPCTDWFLGFTRLAKGNTGLGAALLPINMIVQLILYPVYLHIFGIDAIETGAGNIFETLWQWFLIPLFMGVILRALVEKFLNKDQLQLIQNTVAVIIPVLLAALVGQLSAANIGTLTSNMAIFPLILGAIFLFFTMTFILGEVVSKFMKFNYEDRVLLTMTTGARNAPLMLALTMGVIPDQPIIYAAIIIGMLVELPHLVALKVILLKRNEAVNYS